MTNPIPFLETDCGRKDSDPKERNDCTVRSVAAAFGITYTEAWIKLSVFGRKPKHGVHFKEIAKKLPLEPRYDLACRHLQTILPEMQSGRFIVRIAKHCFAVVHGKVIDTHRPSPKYRVKMVYEVKDTTLDIDKKDVTI